MTIPIFIPRLPTVDDLLPYLREIELSRVYSNFGPMVLRLHSELAKYFGLEVNQVVTLSNATLALEGAIQTSSNGQSKWSSPSWTYAATNLALERCKVEYNFCDIDLEWRLIPDQSSTAIMDVCPFGDTLKLHRFTNQNQTILVDAAGSFPALRDCGKLINDLDFAIGIVVSFHPTKVVPGIEGGVFISNKPEWAQQVQQWSRFGMNAQSRVSHRIGTNAKMNEYQAAMILASLVNFESLKEKWQIIHGIAKQVTDALGLKTHPAMKNQELSSYWIVESTEEFTKIIEARANFDGFQTRRWWEHGCHKMPYFSASTHQNFPRTDFISNSTIGLPFHLDMDLQKFELVHEALNSYKT